MTAGAILTLGLGTFSDVNHLVTLGYGTGATPPAPPAPTPQTTAFAAGGGGGGAFMLTGAGHKKRKKDATVRLDLEAAFALFNEAPAEVKREVREIAAPVTKLAESGAVMIPMDGLLSRLDLATRLLDLYARLRAAEIEDEDDDDFLMAGH